MLNKFKRTMKKIHRDQRGITGLETAIILIAFVTVASVLAYSVLSAGIFSAERSKETVYKGLEHAQSTMESKGVVVATSSDNSTIDTIIFQIASVLPGEQIDFTPPTGNDVTVIKYIDDEVNAQITDWTKTLMTAERGNADFLEDDEIVQITVPVPGTTTLSTYETFTIQVVPPRGSAVTIRRDIPGMLKAMNNLN